MQVLLSGLGITWKTQAPLKKLHSGYHLTNSIAIARTAQKLFYKFEFRVHTLRCGGRQASKEASWFARRKTLMATRRCCQVPLNTTDSPPRPISSPTIISGTAGGKGCIPVAGCKFCCACFSRWFPNKFWVENLYHTDRNASIRGKHANPY